MKSDGWDGDETNDITQWTFMGSLFYSIIVITTIGEFFHIIHKTFKFISSDGFESPDNERK